MTGVRRTVRSWFTSIRWSDGLGSLLSFVTLAVALGLIWTLVGSLFLWAVATSLAGRSLTCFGT